MLVGKHHISERPIEAEKRLQVGHWEGDAVMGSDKHACVLTLVERRSGFAVIKKFTARTAAQATRPPLAPSRSGGQYPHDHLRQWD